MPRTRAYAVLEPANRRTKGRHVKSRTRSALEAAAGTALVVGGFVGLLWLLENEGVYVLLGLGTLILVGGPLALFVGLYSEARR